MRQNHPLVSINLLTHNGEKYLKDCMDSVLSQTYANLEILIIDNASTDKTADFLKKLNSQKIKVVFNEKNLGFSQGHNQAIKQSRGQYILCLNQDVVLDKNFVKEAVQILEKYQKTAAVQGKLLRLGAKDKIDSVGLSILKNRRIISRGQGKIDQAQFDKIEEVFGADGAAPVYRRSALEDVKINFAKVKPSQGCEGLTFAKGEYFDEDFFAYKEDVDLAWRLRLYGWKTIYQPKAVAWHDRTAGESASKNYLGIIKERLKISGFAKYLAFKNQRLTQIKNEQIWLLIRHLPWFLPKEIASWLYVIFFERYTWKAIKDLFRQAPRAWQKRKVIMAKKRAGIKEMEKWFS